MFATPNMTADAKLQETLKALQLRLSVHAGRRLTHSDLADIAEVGARSFGEWMRGATAPPGMLALLRLMSSLPPDELASILNVWRPKSARKQIQSATKKRKISNEKKQRTKTDS